MVRQRSASSASTAASSLHALAGSHDENHREALQRFLVQRVQTASARDRIYVGLDVSSRCTGIAVVDAAGRTVLSEACLTHKEKDVAAVGRCLSEALADVRQRIELTGRKELRVGIEECMRHFMAGKFNARGLVKLAQTNGVAQFVAFQSLGVAPLMVQPTSARAFFGIANRPKGRKAAVDAAQDAKESLPPATTKDRVLNFVLERGVELPENLATAAARYDVADAYIVAWYSRVSDTICEIAESPQLWEHLEVDIDAMRPVKKQREMREKVLKQLWAWSKEHQVAFDVPGNS